MFYDEVIFKFKDIKINFGIEEVVFGMCEYKIFIFKCVYNFGFKFIWRCSCYYSFEFF